MQRFDRIVGLLLELRGEERLTAAGLARRFEVSPRTIYRDVEQLSALGVPVYTERGRGGGIRLLPGYFLPPVMFTHAEAMSLVAGLTLLRSLRAHPFAGEIEGAERKLLAAVPDHLRAVLAGAATVLGFESVPGDVFHPEPDDAATPGDAAAESAVLTAFLRAIFERRRLRMLYRSPYRGGAERLLVEPAGAFLDRGYWYLTGRLDGRDRIWRADRAGRLEDAGPLPSAVDGDVRDLLGRRWLAPAMRRWADEAPVRIRLSPQQRGRLAGDWYYQHARFEPQPDGGYVMTVGESDPAIALALLRWLGPGAELLEPPAWRELARRELRAMLAAYDAPSREG